MKRLLYIPLVLLITFSGISLKYAAHYCKDFQVASKISLTGKLADCGMENQKVNNHEGYNIKSHCCDNLTISFLLNSNYLFKSVLVVEKGNTHYITINSHIISLDRTGESSLPVNVLFRPPGSVCPNSVALQSLCTFRI